MDSVIKVPAEAMTGVQSFAIDFGGSVLKLVYLKKDDVHPEGFVLVHQRSFARANFQEAIDFIKKECEIPASTDGRLPEYILTGVGTHQFHKTIKDQLKIRVSTKWELGCFQEAFKLLVDNLPEKELYHPPVFHGHDAMNEQMENLSKFVEEIGIKKEEDNDKDVQTFPAADEKWPCLMGVLGSAFGFMKLLEDGTVTRGKGSHRGGRMFLGLGSLLTGAKTYEELMELAEKGDDHKVHCYTKELMQSEEADESENLYGKFSKFDMLCFSFGWCVGKPLSDFRREDLARALLVIICHDIIQSCLELVEKLQVTRIILVGGFAQAPLTRQIIEEGFAMGTKVTASIDPTNPMGRATLHVMKAGSHLGALGAMLQSKPKSQGQQETVEDAENIDTKL